jgi:hypothetical protein
MNLLSWTRFSFFGEGGNIAGTTSVGADPVGISAAFAGVEVGWGGPIGWRGWRRPGVRVGQGPNRPGISSQAGTVLASPTGQEATAPESPTDQAAGLLAQQAREATDRA